jgi:predicted DNA-binding protein
MGMSNQTKLATSFRLSPECRQLLVTLSRRLGISQADVVELATRHLADREQVRQGTDSVRTP